MMVSGTVLVASGHNGMIASSDSSSSGHRKANSSDDYLAGAVKRPPEFSTRCDEDALAVCSEHAVLLFR